MSTPVCIVTILDGIVRWSVVSSRDLSEVTYSASLLRCCRIHVANRSKRWPTRRHCRDSGHVQTPHERPDGSVQWRPDRRPPAARGERRGALKQLVREDDILRIWRTVYVAQT